MINAPSSIRNTLVSGNFDYANLVKVNLGDVYGTTNDLILYYTDCTHDLIYGGDTYVSENALRGIEGISRKATTGSDKVDIPFFISDQVIIDAIKANTYVHKPTSIDRVIVENGVIKDGYLIPVRTAWAVSHSIKGDQTEREITLTIDSTLGDLEGDNGWYALNSSHQVRHASDQVMKHAGTVFTEDQKRLYTSNKFNGVINDKVKPPALPKIYGYKNAELVPIAMLKHRKSHTLYRHYFTTLIYVVSIGDVDNVDLSNLKKDDESFDLTIVTNTNRDIGGWSCRLRTPDQNESLIKTDLNLEFFREGMDTSEENRLNSMYGKGLTLLFVKNRNRDDWLSSPPRLTVPVRGAMVYDPRLGPYYPPDFVGPIGTPTSVYSRNPALQYADYINSVEYGAGNRNINLSTSNITDLANHFDTLPGSTGNPGINNILFDVQIDTGDPIIDNMNVWINGTRLFTSDYYGEYLIRVETISNVVWAFNENDLSSIPDYDAGESIDRITQLTYTIKQLVPDVSTDALPGALVEVDVETTYPTYGDSIHTEWLAENGGIDKFDSKSLSYVSEIQQSLFWTMVDARISRKQDSLTISPGPIGWLFEVGDVVSFTSETVSESNFYWRVFEISEEDDDVELELIPYDDNFYTPDPNLIPTPPSLAVIPKLESLPVVVGTSILTIDDVQYLNWTLPTSNITYYSIEIVIVDGSLSEEDYVRVYDASYYDTPPLRLPTLQPNETVGGVVVPIQYRALIVPNNSSTSNEGLTAEYDFTISIPSTPAGSATVTSKQGFITVTPPSIDSRTQLYEFRYSNTVDTEWIDGGENTSLTISNVLPGVSYTIEYKLVSTVGAGEWVSINVSGVRGAAVLNYSGNTSSTPPVPTNAGDSTGIAACWVIASVGTVYVTPIVGDNLIITNDVVPGGWTHVYKYTNDGWTSASTFFINGNQIVTGSFSVLNDITIGGDSTFEGSGNFIDGFRADSNDAFVVIGDTSPTFPGTIGVGTNRAEIGAHDATDYSSITTTPTTVYINSTGLVHLDGLDILLGKDSQFGPVTPTEVNITGNITGFSADFGSLTVNGIPITGGTGAITYTAGNGLDLSTTEFSLETATDTNLGGVTLGTGATQAAFGNHTHNYAPVSHDHDRLKITDSRGAIRPPSYYDDKYAQWDFQNQADTLAGGDTWHAILTVAKRHAFNVSYKQEQLLFTGTDLKRRTATSDSAWGTIKTMLDSGNFNTYAPTKTGVGASGSGWNISILGDAATATIADKIDIRDNNLSTGYYQMLFGSGDFAFSSVKVKMQASTGHITTTGNITATGNVFANQVVGTFTGNGLAISNIDADNITTGLINSLRVPVLNQDTLGNAATADYSTSAGAAATATNADYALDAGDANTLDGLNSPAFGRLASAGIWSAHQQFNGGADVQNLDVNGGANFYSTATLLAPVNVTSGVTAVCVETANNGQIKHGSAAAIRSFIGLNTTSNVTFGAMTSSGIVTGTKLVADNGNARGEVGINSNGFDSVIWSRGSDNQFGMDIGGGTRVKYYGDDTLWEFAPAIECLSSMTATSFLPSASALRKKNILSRLHNTLDDVCAIGDKGVPVYTLKANPELDPRYGFIVEETDQYFPHATFYETNGQMKTMDYMQMIPPLYVSTKQLNDKIEAQQVIIDSLITRLNTLENI